MQVHCVPRLDTKMTILKRVDTNIDANNASAQLILHFIDLKNMKGKIDQGKI